MTISEDPRNTVLHGGPDSPYRKKQSSRGHEAAHFYEHMQECIPHCLPAAGGECACTVDMADKCICRGDG